MEALLFQVNDLPIGGKFTFAKYEVVKTENNRFTLIDGTVVKIGLFLRNIKAILETNTHA